MIMMAKVEKGPREVAGRCESTANSRCRLSSTPVRKAQNRIAQKEFRQRKQVSSNYMSHGSLADLMSLVQQYVSLLMLR